MSIKGTVAFALTLALASSSMSSVLLRAAQENGALAGKATDKAKQPYSDYVVRVRNVNNPAVIQTVPLTATGTFSFAGLALTQNYLVDLVNTKQNKVVCTEGPYALGSSMMAKNDINIDCGRNPTAFLLAAGAGAAIIAAATQSNGQ
jgi:hypothetical protein